jgi:hypothetical protein
MLSGIEAGSASGDRLVLAPRPSTRGRSCVRDEPVFAALFGYMFAGDQFGALGWGGCAAIVAGIVLAEPAAGTAFVWTVARGPRRRP